MQDFPIVSQEFHWGVHHDRQGKISGRFVRLATRAVVNGSLWGRVSTKQQYRDMVCRPGGRLLLRWYRTTRQLIPEESNILISKPGSVTQHLLFSRSRKRTPNE
jgi:hypothetical protein